MNDSKPSDRVVMSVAARFALILVAGPVGATCLLLGGSIHPAHAADPWICRIDRAAGQIAWTKGVERPVTITRDRETFTADLPVCVEHGDHVEIAGGMGVHIDTVSEHGDREATSEPSVWDVPPASRPPEGGAVSFAAALWNGLFGPTQSISLYAASRAASACPPSSTPPPLAPVSRLRETSQQIGADLRAIVPMWQPSPEPRLVRAKLLRQDGSVLVQSSTCHGSSAPLLLRANDLHPGDHLTLLLTDTHEGSLHYDITVVDPASLPQPPAQVEEDWLAATWRLTSPGSQTQLDSIARIAKATETSFGAQRVLGAVATDQAF